MGKTIRTILMGVKTKCLSLPVWVIILVVIFYMSVKGSGNYLPLPDKQMAVSNLELKKGAQKGRATQLAGAKNEYLNLHFRVKGADPASLKVQVNRKEADRGISYQLYQVCWAPAASRGNFPADALIPLDQGLRDTGDVLEIWATIKIPASLAAGTYYHELIFADKKGTYTQPLELRVWNIALPDDLPIVIMGNLWGVRDWFARYGVNSGAQFDEAIREYLRSMREYKINSLGPRFYPFPVMQLAGGKKVEDFPGYHQVLSYALNELRYRSFCIPRINLGKKSLQDKSSFIQPAKDYYPLFTDYLKRHHWESRAFNKVMDEPLLPYYPSVYETYALVRGMVPTVKTLCTGREPDPRLARVIDVWVMSAKSYNSSKIAAARAQGQEIWLYANRLHRLNHPLVSQRLIGWFLYRDKFSGYFFWGVNAWHDDPWTRETGKGDYFRSGILYYPNPRNGSPWPTTRLEALRRGFQDYQYLVLLDQAKERGRISAKTYDDIRRRVEGVTRDLSRGEPQVTMGDLENLRHQIGEVLDKAAQ